MATTVNKKRPVGDRMLVESRIASGCALAMTFREAFETLSMPVERETKPVRFLKSMFGIGSAYAVLKAKFRFAASPEICFYFDVAKRYAEQKAGTRYL
ncbi:MAG: hypothetical protein LBK94_05085 [Prevotellaceae bacterium]|jgi:hypothetical protein|nr:hypothetical protein [Prevotellaceae bacterium]